MARPFQVEPSEKVINKYIGKVFSRLTVESFSHRQKTIKGSMYYFNCICECGNKTVVYAGYLNTGHTKSCGCIKNDPHSWDTDKFKDGIKKENEYHVRLRRIWYCMIKRCNDQKDKNHLRYGKRGISVCSDWLEYENFKNWALSNGYSNELSIDRINNNGNYEPSNCKWSNCVEQANNRRSNYFIEHNGERLSYAQWSLRLGDNPSLVWARIKKLGWDEIKAVTTEV
jgi:hypothetical protein